ncbi:NADH dehydrogenase [ubiquinone] 1 alpha subcomplex subunit 5 isoform X2 [Nilaparvata lugens]|uniref:NADH dehydrogenase [ubiquinone] 1 alpha subcomplex subunit 5 isoform X2 n=1 Tax=Nilaparvata lugens TaxID=108931 RepID=UPI000B98239E|nr:NADH dehydrogenase [ubiquinone] 1 alpha subcomplex subunit 5 isoform X2 [Nilaparvata lugens]
MAAAGRKLTTGLTGMKVLNEPHKILTSIYSKILSVTAKMPENAAYRKHTEEIVKTRLDVVKSTTNVAELESKINCGQAEELVIQADNELQLARKMLVWKPWEPLIADPPPNQWKWPPVK